MAEKITHIESLSQVIKHLEHGSTVQRRIASLLKREDVRNYANLGSVAPDIFYFYHVLSPKRTRKASVWGDRSHHSKVAELVFSFLDRVSDTEESLFRDRFLAFTLGYICHCVVDVITHPYIFYISGDYYNKDPKVAYDAQLNHMRVEYGLDSFLIHHRWGLTPREYDFPHYIDIRHKLSTKGKKMDTMLWKFWIDSLRETYPREFSREYIGSYNKIIAGDILNESYLGFYTMSKVVDSRSSFVRGFLKFVDAVSFHKVKSSVLLLPLKENIDPRIMNHEKNTWTYPSLPDKKSDDSFIELLNQAVLLSKDILTVAYEYAESPSEKERENLLAKYSGYNLDTGLQDDISNMKEFSPLV
ncbi:zinc dependent phospholipase C family protein [Leptospira sp. GIMC2001]|uniref:zinc dependent phospholipase C family protein n=1 Tax=Leptospira sp. GIMC2001 TaxID=1513297 RepID=UPI00234AC0B6|nr:zinc dependent phospholipase C family protein [Leptospira sp. GIMC2001]WCL50883.1 zinc dependent phospholipase C family protein [Leptospira sp. GIMC2001]